MLFSTNVSGIIQEKTQVYCGRGTTKKQVVDYGTEITSKSLKGALFPLLSCSQCANVRRMKPAQGAEHFFFSPATLLPRTRWDIFTLSDLHEKPWSQASSLLPPCARLHFYRA